MAYEESTTFISLPAGGNLSAKQYHAVLLANDGQVDAVASQGVRCTGILANDPDTAGKVAKIATGGVCKWVSGDDNIVIGSLLTTGADGRAEVAASGDFVIGQALTLADDGGVLSCLLTYDGTLT